MSAIELSAVTDLERQRSLFGRPRKVPSRYSYLRFHIEIVVIGIAKLLAHRLGSSGFCSGSAWATAGATHAGGGLERDSTVFRGCHRRRRSLFAFSIK